MRRPYLSGIRPPEALRQAQSLPIPSVNPKFPREGLEHEARDRGHRSSRSACHRGRRWHQRALDQHTQFVASRARRTASEVLLLAISCR
jgi:hypothetical protein